MRRPIAADYDGTFDSHPELWGNIDLIITGNPWQSYDDVMNSWEGPKKPTFWNPIDPEDEVMAIINHKADIINKTKARRFYEDQEEQAAILRIMCPECEIVLVTGGSTFI